MFYQKPEQPREKVKYTDIRKCFFKKEMGEHTEECKKIFDKSNIEE